MGFFSWRTADTDKSIPNIYSGIAPITVYLLQPNGRPTIKEDEYEGYGDFGGEDVYALLAEWHGQPKDRSIGIDIAFSGKCEFPIKLVENPKLKYEDVEASESCEHQGYFYDEEDEEDECLDCHYSMDTCQC